MVLRYRKFVVKLHATIATYAQKISMSVDLVSSLLKWRSTDGRARFRVLIRSDPNQESLAILSYHPVGYSQPGLVCPLSPKSPCLDKETAPEMCFLKASFTASLFFVIIFFLFQPSRSSNYLTHPALSCSQAGSFVCFVLHIFYSSLQLNWVITFFCLCK